MYWNQDFVHEDLKGWRWLTNKYFANFLPIWKENNLQHLICTFSCSCFYFFLLRLILKDSKRHDISLRCITSVSMICLHKFGEPYLWVEFLSSYRKPNKHLLEVRDIWGKKNGFLFCSSFHLHYLWPRAASWGLVKII